MGARQAGVPNSAPTAAPARPLAPLSPVHPHAPNQPASRAGSGVPEGSPGLAEARPPRAYPVLGLQSLLTAALGTALAPGWGRAQQVRGWPVLLGQLWSLLLPWGGLKQTPHAVRIRSAACLSALLGSEERSPSHLCSHGSWPLWRTEAGSGSAGLASATGQTVPVGLRPGRPRRLPWMAWAPKATFLHVPRPC